jgi:glycosyltransferase involved in cell wall biosynthesis
VEHHPAVARWELPGFYQQMDVFVLPSLIEGFPQTALEAMACGVPVIVSENTFGTDVVIDGHNGYVVPIRDVDAIVDHVRALADDESLRSAMATNARATAERFTWEAFGRRLLELVSGP